MKYSSILLATTGAVVLSGLVMWGIANNSGQTLIAEKRLNDSSYNTKPVVSSPIIKTTLTKTVKNTTTHAKESFPPKVESNKDDNHLSTDIEEEIIIDEIAGTLTVKNAATGEIIFQTHLSDDVIAANNNSQINIIESISNVGSLADNIATEEQSLPINGITSYGEDDTSIIITENGIETFISADITQDPLNIIRSIPNSENSTSTP